MKTALVTGSSGFVGRHMVRELCERGYGVSEVDLVHPLGSIDALDVFRGKRMTQAFDLVVHCAYWVGGRAAIDGVNSHFARNVQLDGALFEWAARVGQPRVLYFSSSAAYPVDLQRREDCYGSILLGDDQPNSYRLREDDVSLDLNGPMGAMPDANYGWAKLTGERLAEEARRNGVSVTVVRPFSGYGGDQSLDYPFPSIVRRAMSGDLIVWGPPGQTRDWIHIDDVVHGALAVVESGTEDPVNLCTGRPVEMGELARMAYSSAYVVDEYEHIEVEYLIDKPTGVFYRVGDPSRMLKYYTPRISLEEGVREAVLRIRNEGGGR